MVPFWGCTWISKVAKIRALIPYVDHDLGYFGGPGTGLLIRIPNIGYKKELHWKVQEDTVPTAMIAMFCTSGSEDDCAPSLKGSFWTEKARGLATPIQFKPQREPKAEAAERAQRSWANHNELKRGHP